ncbi:MAG: hypothetical protein EAX96_09620 [Candidatus Lokiarchaeota archaeon]|nr:hypothetical protein [Candidatus Lokiarchaeota archaeon]
MNSENKIKQIENLSHKNFRFFEGKIEGYKSRFCIFKEEQLEAFYKSLSEHFMEGKEAILKKIGQDYGTELFNFLIKDMLDEKLCFKYILTELNKLGWGKFWNITFEKDSISLEYHYPLEIFGGKEISGHYIIGIIKGIAIAYLKEEVKDIEEDKIERGNLIFFKLKFIKTSIYKQNWKKLNELTEILNEFDNKSKTNYSMIISATGEILAQNKTDKIDKDKFSTIVSMIHGGILTLSEMEVGSFIQFAIMYDDGVIMATSTNNRKAIIVGALNKQASVNLIGIALKQSCEKLEKVL